MFDLLSEPVIPVRRTGCATVRKLSLPMLFGELCADGIDAFPGLAAHQAPAWYRFLAQLGAIALDAAGEREAPTHPVEWHGLLAALTPAGHGSMWSLAVAPEQTAFLQPPTDRFADYRPYAETPDELDVLVTAKNHDRKRSVALRGDPHLWLYALVNLQTTEGYSGRGRLGIARMNGGLSSRALADLRPGGRWGPRVVRAIRMLLRERDGILGAHEYYQADGGLALTWTRPWDSDVQLELSELDPYFIEVCRRIRLVPNDAARLRAVARPAKKPRTGASQFGGNLGDPWVPVDHRGAKGPRALTVGAAGFDYRLAQKILFSPGEIAPPPAVTPYAEDERVDCEFHLATLVRGQGRTDGFHERIIPIPRALVPELGAGDEESDPDDDDDDLASLAALSSTMVQRAAAARKVLRQALIVFLCGPEQPNFQAKDPWMLTRFDRRVDERFFGHLFEAPDLGREGVSTKWQVFLLSTCRDIARRGFAQLSPPSARREKARAAAESRLHFGLRRELPDGFPPSEATEDRTNHET